MLQYQIFLETTTVAFTENNAVTEFWMPNVDFTIFFLFSIQVKLRTRINFTKKKLQKWKNAIDLELCVCLLSVSFLARAHVRLIKDLTRPKINSNLTISNMPTTKWKRVLYLTVTVTFLVIYTSSQLNSIASSTTISKRYHSNLIKCVHI